jgi:drug/metabolite transporter (DMT)-like permease
MLGNFIVLLYVALVWASGIVFIKVEESTIPPITIMAGRALLAFLTLFIAALITRKDLAGHLKYIGKFLVFAILGISLLWLGLAFGQEYISVGLASVLVLTLPLVTFIILVLILRVEPFSVMGLAGLIMGIAGIVLVIGIDKIMAGGSTILGVLLIGGGFGFLAINGILAGKWAKGIDPVITTTYFLGLGAVILTVLAFIFERPMQVPWTTDTIASELALGVICTASGYFGYYFIIHMAGAYFSSFIFYFIPVFGLISGHLFLKEKVGISQVIGVIIVLAGVYLINWEKRKGG